MDLQLKVKRFEELTAEELYRILKLRVDVFVVEQACPYPELDGLDQESLHVYYEDPDGQLAAYLRMFAKPKEEGCVQIGRVIAAKRGHGLGRAVMLAGLQAAPAAFGAREAYLEAQVYAKGFYEGLGFSVCSDEFDEDGIPHVQMRRRL